MDGNYVIASELLHFGEFDALITVLPGCDEPYGRPGLIGQSMAIHAGDKHG